MGMESITPEHICIALCKSKNTGGVRALHGCAAHNSPVKGSLLQGTACLTLCRRHPSGTFQYKRTLSTFRCNQGEEALTCIQPRMPLEGSCTCRLGVDIQATRAECIRRIKDDAETANRRPVAFVRLQTCPCGCPLAPLCITKGVSNP